MIYDTILVGSSPLNLLEAIYLKQKGQKVLVIDRQSKIGGAWATTELNGLPDLEIGCHIWDIIPEVITFLGRYLELDLQPLQPQPRIKYGKTSFPYDWKHNALFLKKLAYHTKHFSWEKMHAENKEVKKYRFSILPKKYCYPVGGSTDLIKALERKIELHQPEIKLNTNITQLKQEADIAQLTTNNGVFSAKQVQLTSLSAIEEIVDPEGKTHHPVLEDTEYIHFHLLYKDNGSKPFSYIRLYKDPVLHRISDITNQIQQSDSSYKIGHKLVLAGIHATAFNEMGISATLEHTSRVLKKNGYIHSSAELIIQEHNIFPSQYLQNETLTILKNNFSSIITRHSTNFIFGLSPRIKEWKTVLK